MKMENVYTQIQRTYKSFSKPEFFFVSDALQKRPYKEVIEQISPGFQVEEDTDPNDDVTPIQTSNPRSLDLFQSGNS